MLFFSPPPPPLSSLPSWSPLPCCLIGRETLGKIVGISFHRSPRLSTRVMSCLFGIMHSRRSRSPQTPHLLLLPPLWISRSATQICVGACCCIQQPAGVLTHAGIARARANTRARRSDKRTRPPKQIPTRSCDAGHTGRKKGEFGVLRVGFECVCVRWGGRGGFSGLLRVTRPGVFFSLRVKRRGRN